MIGLLLRDSLSLSIFLFNKVSALIAFGTSASEFSASELPAIELPAIELFASESEPIFS